MQCLIKKTSFRLATNYIIVVQVVSDLIAGACGLQLMGRGWWVVARGDYFYKHLMWNIRRQRLCHARLIWGGFNLYNYSSHRGGRGALTNTIHTILSLV